MLIMTWSNPRVRPVPLTRLVEIAHSGFGGAQVQRLRVLGIALERLLARAGRLWTPGLEAGRSQRSQRVTRGDTNRPMRTQRFRLEMARGLGNGHKRRSAQVSYSPARA